MSLALIVALFVAVALIALVFYVFGAENPLSEWQRDSLIGAIAAWAAILLAESKINGRQAAYMLIVGVLFGFFAPGLWLISGWFHEQHDFTKVSIAGLLGALGMVFVPPLFQWLNSKKFELVTGLIKELRKKRPW